MLTECAVRGIETAAGAVCGVVTERGAIKCKAVVLAGGAWSSLFAGSIGIYFPQLKVVNSVLRTTAVADGPEQAMWCRKFALRKRQDGGYTISSGYDNVVNIVPKSFRYAFAFLPALRKEWRSLKLHIGREFLDEAGIPNRWPLDQVSPFEHNRTLDPTPNKRMVDKAFEAAKRACPSLGEAEIAQRWAGCMDVTPDAVPVISAVDKMPGFFLASGFSGHGFGIGPAAGRLVADLVINRTPLVDPAHFRLTRFTDGSKIEMNSGY